MIVKHLVERIEGEAVLNLEWENQKISHATIVFPHFRGFEKLLQGKPALDAVVLTPRVCGICGQAHVACAIDAIENLYISLGQPCEISPKALAIRQFCCDVEVLQSHLKWFFWLIRPSIAQALGKTNNDLFKQAWGDVQESLAHCGQMIALLGGQYPHTSFWIPGGVMCDPSAVTLFQLEKLLTQVERNAQKLLGEAYNQLWDDGCRLGLDQVGYGPSRYRAFGHESGKYDPLSITETSPRQGYAKVVRYDGFSYEVGPLARRILRDPSVDRSALGRMMARVDEIPDVLRSLRSTLNTIDLSQPSAIPPLIPIEKISGEGFGCVEAARGSLIHKVVWEEGIITHYDIITPTVWNLGDHDEKSLGVCQEALIGLQSVDQAMLVLRSFDVCAVCTTH